MFYGAQDGLFFLPQSQNVTERGRFDLSFITGGLFRGTVDETLCTDGVFPELFVLPLQGHKLELFGL